MKEIKKKIQPKYFKEVAEGKKDFEIRKDDSDYQVGDILILQEYQISKRLSRIANEERGHYTGNEITKRIKYKITHGEYPDGIKEGYCVLGLEDIEPQGIKLVNIDLTEISKIEQKYKVKEELKEFQDAICDHIVYPTEKTKNHAIEEYFDLIQSALGQLEKQGITAEEAMKEYPKHLEKLKSRPRHKEG